VARLGDARSRSPPCSRPSRPSASCIPGRRRRRAARSVARPCSGSPRGPPGDIADTTATLSFFAIGSSSVGNTYSWHFAWGLSGGSLDQTTLGSDTIDPGTFASHGTTITGLQPNTTYDVQAVATNTLSDEVDGPVLTFTTTDPCAAGHCLSLSGAHTPNTFATGADVTVTVHTGGYPTQWHVEWQSGSETGYPNHSSPEQSVPGNAPDQAYTVHIGGLTPSTAYTARIVATNTAVPVQTAEVDFTFSTLDSCSARRLPLDPLGGGAGRLRHERAHRREHRDLRHTDAVGARVQHRHVVQLVAAGADSPRLLGPRRRRRDADRPGPADAVPLPVRRGQQRGHGGGA